MRAVLYLRYSSDKQTEQSIEGQERVCRAFCEQQDIQIVDSYIDRAVSAYKNTDNRLAFQRMIADAAKDKFDVIVVYKLDRFSRNRYDSAIYKNKLKKCGVRVISATEPVSDSPEGIILEAMLEAMAEYYSQELSQKIKRGMGESARKHRYLGGQIPFGYKVEDGILVIDPDTAPYVKQAFEMYADGHLLTEICKIFNDKGLKTSKGASFNKCSFHSIFHNTRYIGIYTYGDYRQEGIVPPIVDKELFDRVQERMASFRHTPGVGRAKVDYLLSGKLFCGHCQTMMIGHSGTSKTGRQYHYYVCPQHQKRKCKKKNIPKDVLERAVLEDAKELLTPEIIEQLADLCMKAVEEENRKNTDVAEINQNIADVDRRLANLASLAEQTGKIEQITQRIGTLLSEKETLLKRLTEAQKSIIHLERDMVVWWLSQFVNGDIDDPAFAKRLINVLIASVIVYDDDDDGFYLDILYTSSGKKRITKDKISSLIDCFGSPLTSQENTLSATADGEWLFSRKKHSL